ncbi:flavoprotein [Nocardiopsis ansamitocini]|uniref:Flavoprotein n=1 Tax=Nocardiopsis ansamitocini TaxID=1670832 RepID=A0A9W6PB29_9ACTN|nr:flavoprotein [Nocardiopsis ansamitocini]GLU50304.1 flavoprotein [Nocardiopsis ansamitocini]
MTTPRTRELYLTMAAAGIPRSSVELVRSAQEAGWNVTVLCTPDGTRFHDLEAIEDLTGEPVRVAYRAPGTGKSLPPPDALLACPFTFNSVNKFANGIADNFVVSLMCEMAGYGVPMLVVPNVGPQLARHPAFSASLATLGRMGVDVFFDADAPQGERLPSWERVIERLGRLGAGEAGAG